MSILYKLKAVQKKIRIQCKRIRNSFYGKKSTIIKRVIACGLLGIVAINNIVQPFMSPYAFSSYYDELGTNAALGSPLLNSAFDSASWNPAELIIFGIFLSNFCVPCYDSYETALSSGKGGSDGDGLQALNFSVGGGTVESNKALKQMVSYCIKNQMEGKKELYVKAKTNYMNTVKVEDLNKQATSNMIMPWGYSTTFADDKIGTIESVVRGIKDFFDKDKVHSANFNSWVKENSEGKPDVKISGTKVTYELDKDKLKDSTDGAALSYLQSGEDSILLKSDGMDSRYIAFANSIAGYEIYFTSETGDKVTVFDTTDAWDVGTFGGFFASIGSRDDVADIKEGLDKFMVKGANQLFLDTFGNICTSEGIVLYPACANQYLTKDKKYNLLNSMILTQSYMSNIPATYNVCDGNSSPFQLLNGDNPQFVIYEDTDAEIGPSVFRRTLKSGLIVNEEDLDVSYGQVLSNLLSSDISDENRLNSFKFASYSLQYAGQQFDYDKFTNSWWESIKHKGKGYLKSYLGKGGMWTGITDYFEEYNIGITPANTGEEELFGNDEMSYKRWVASFLTRLDAIQSFTPTDKNVPTLTYFYGASGNKIHLFDDPEYRIAGIETLKYGTNAQKFAKYALDYISSNDKIATSVGDIDSGSSLKQQISTLKTHNQVSNLLIYGNSNGVVTDGPPSNLYLQWISNNSLVSSGASQLPGLSSMTEEIDGGGYVNPTMSKYKEAKCSEIVDNALWRPAGTKYGSDEFNYDTITNSPDILKDVFSRVVKIYKSNDHLKTAMKYFNLSENFDFAAWAPYIYLTYLDWYGIQDPSTSLNTKVFDLSDDVYAVNGEEFFSNVTISADKKKSAIVDYVYSMLSINSGEDYRAELGMSWINSLIYKWYCQVCNSTIGSDSSADINTTSAKGFLTVYKYSENPFTSTFIEEYSKIAATVVILVCAMIVVIGLLKSKRASWFAVAIGGAVALLYGAPTIGETVPYICNRAVTNMFSKNMTYWAMNESISNASMEEKYVGNNSKDGEVMELIRMLQMTSQLDKTIQLRNDISSKVVSVTTPVEIEKLQTLKSYTWLLPTIMRQYTARDGSMDYIRTLLADQYDNASSVYWYYNPMDLISVNNYAANNWVYPSETTRDKIAKTNPINFYAGWNDTYNSKGDIAYKWKSMKDDEELTGAEGVKEADISENPELAPDDVILLSNDQKYDSSSTPTHHKIYLLNIDAENNALAIPNVVNEVAIDNGGKFTKDDWNTLMSAMNTDNKKSAYIKQKYNAAMNNMTADLVRSVTNYKQYKTEINPDFGYLWSTENPFVYFYSVVKDTFPSSFTETAVFQQIQGSYEKSAIEKKGRYDSDEARVSFMHYKNTGYTKDFLDLEHLFTNVIPYLYEVQIMAGGSDGENGLLGDKTLGDYGYTVYDTNKASWLYRSNWATKIMEFSKYCNEDTGYYYRDGKRRKFKTTYPCIPQTYKRAMVFSKAQMYAEGLTEADLTYIEQKCIDINEKVASEWTMLLNYANVEGVTAEVLYRQMALEATTIFNDIISPDVLSTSSTKLYPNAIELENISFDSVMSMIIASGTNAGYSINNIMLNCIKNEGLVASIILLLDAFLSVGVIPLLRNFLMAMLFYMIYIVMIRTIIKRGNKSQIFVGFLVSNLLCLAMTLFYYGVFSVMIKSGVIDTVLTDNDTSFISTTVSLWKLLIVLAVSIVYIIGNALMIRLLWQNRTDMGFSVYATLGNMAVSRIGGALGGVKEGISGIGSSLTDRFNSSSSSENVSSNNTVSTADSNNIPGKTNSNSSKQGASVQNGSVNSNTDRNMESYSTRMNDRDVLYDLVEEDEKKAESEAADIDKDIEQGKKSI